MKIIAALLLVGLGASAQTPADWQNVKDRKGLCQMSVPAGWTGDKIMPSNLTSPDKKSSVIFSSKPAGVTYADIVGMAKQMFKPAQTFEDSGSRTWFASAPASGKMSWYVALGTSPVCEAQIEFRDPAFEAAAKQMVNSLKPVK